VLVYRQTHSPLLAAVTFTASLVPNFLGGILLSPIADRLPRRPVMIGADVISGLLVAAMAVPGLPLAALIVLLAAVTMVGALFQAARAAISPDVLTGDRYVLGTAITLTTLQFAQVVGFAVGGVAVALLGLRTSLLADAATFAASALITRIWVHRRPAAAADRVRPARRAGGALARPVAGLRLVFTHPAMRTAMLFGWLCAFYNVPEGVATPLAAARHGGAVTVGLILASAAFGSTVGALCFSRLVPPGRRIRFMGPLAVAACGLLIVFAAHPGLAGVLVILAASGLCTCYQLAANASFVRATPPEQRSQAFGIAQGGINLGQGLVIVLAGAAAERFTPDAVICAVGGLGALCAALLAVSQAAHPRWRSAAPVTAASAGPEQRG
jgi:MFS family permease